MKQDTQENNGEERFVEQDSLGPPDATFYVSEELAAQLKRFEGQSFLIGGDLDQRRFNYDYRF
jgi:hypothetical protein